MLLKLVENIFLVLGIDERRKRVGIHLSHVVILIRLMLSVSTLLDLKGGPSILIQNEKIGDS